MLLLADAPLRAANITPYDDRAAFTADTVATTLIDFDTVRNACVAIPDREGLTASNVNFNGGVARSTSSGPCSPPLTAFQGCVLSTRLVIR
jgi:hypothetical protein